MPSGLTPTATRFRTISATTTGDDMIPGAPEQLTLIPTISAGVMKRAHASRTSASPVKARMPCAIISRTTAGSGFSLAGSMQLPACTEATCPG